MEVMLLVILGSGTVGCIIGIIIGSIVTRRAWQEAMSESMLTHLHDLIMKQKGE